MYTPNIILCSPKKPNILNAVNSKYTGHLETIETPIPYCKPPGICQCCRKTKSNLQLMPPPLFAEFPFLLQFQTARHSQLYRLTHFLYHLTVVCLGIGGMFPGSSPHCSFSFLHNLLPRLSNLSSRERR